MAEPEPSLPDHLEPVPGQKGAFRYIPRHERLGTPPPTLEEILEAISTPVVISRETDIIEDQVLKVEKAVHELRKAGRALENQLTGFLSMMNGLRALCQQLQEENSALKKQIKELSR